MTRPEVLPDNDPKRSTIPTREKDVRKAKLSAEMHERHGELLAEARELYQAFQKG